MPTFINFHIFLNFTFILIIFGLYVSFTFLIFQIPLSTIKLFYHIHLLTFTLTLTDNKVIIKSIAVFGGLRVGQGSIK